MSDHSCLIMVNTLNFTNLWYNSFIATSHCFTDCTSSWDQCALHVSCFGHEFTILNFLSHTDSVFITTAVFHTCVYFWNMCCINHVMLDDKSFICHQMINDEDNTNHRPSLTTKCENISRWSLCGGGSAPYVWAAAVCLFTGVSPDQDQVSISGSKLLG